MRQVPAIVSHDPIVFCRPPFSQWDRLQSVFSVKRS
jgi:hypothetical protein